MLVDCETCEVRGAACGDCVLTVLWGLPGAEDADRPGEAVGQEAVVLDADDRQALRVLADAGLAPRLRHVGRRAG